MSFYIFEFIRACAFFFFVIILLTIISDGISSNNQKNNSYNSCGTTRKLWDNVILILNHTTVLTERYQKKLTIVSCGTVVGITG